MTRRDLRWRAAGLALFAAAGALGLGGDDGAVAGLVRFGLALTGIVLMIGGRRLAVAWRAARR